MVYNAWPRKKPGGLFGHPVSSLGKVSRNLSPHGRVAPGQEVLETSPGGVVQVLGRVSLHMAVDECRIELSIVPVLHASFTANQNSVDCA